MQFTVSARAIVVSTGKKQRRCRASVLRKKCSPIADCIVRRDRGAKSERDEDRPLDTEALDKLLQVAGLVVQREAVIGPLGPDVAAVVVDKAAMIAREIRDLLVPVFHAVDLAVDEDEIAALSMLLIVKLAAVHGDRWHGLSRRLQ